MTKILIAPVGKQDPISPKNGQPGAILTICQSEQPDVVYLLPTADMPGVQSHTEAEAAATKAWITENLPGARAYVRGLQVSNPSRFDQVVPEVTIVVGRVVEETANLDDREFLVNASSGTPQITTSCLLLVASGLLPGRVRTLQVANPDQLTSGAPRITETDLGFLREKLAIERVRSLYARHQFALAAEELDRLATSIHDVSRRAAARGFSLVCAAYGHLDRQDYGQAAGSLKTALKSLGDTRQFQSVDAVLRRQLEAADRLMRPTAFDELALLVDVYWGAQRRLDDGSLVDVVTRAWRVAEGALQVYLRARWGIEADKLGDSTNQAKAVEIGLRLGRTMDDSLGFWDLQNALDGVLSDAEWRKLAGEQVRLPTGKRGELRIALEQLRFARNQSVAGHGSSTVTKDMAQGSLDAAERILRFAGRFPPQGVQFVSPEDWPFASPRLVEVGVAAFAAL